jgi:exodeoxyribonuclease VII large subunit
MDSLSFNFDDDPAPSEPAPANPTWTVTSITAEIHRLLTRRFDDVRVAGEVSGYKVWNSGHAYFTLKDEGAQLRCVMFRGPFRYLRFKPADGLAVIARGSVEVRQERGEYQLIVSGMEPQGYGALQLAFEQLKRKLADEGLFDPARKRPLPAYPRHIGIVTSPKGAVIRDMLSVLRRRWPGLHIRLYPTQVQGEGAAEGICAGLAYFSSTAWPEVIIVGRGGGSLEDLWTFNEESVARAIAASSIPVVSAVGHETDFTIADFVADLRAPTPSAAAERVVQAKAELGGRIDTLGRHLDAALRLRLARTRARVEAVTSHRVFSAERGRLRTSAQRLDDLAGRAERALHHHVRRAQEALRRERDRLEAFRWERQVAERRERVGRAALRLAALAEDRLHRARAEWHRHAGKLEALSPLGVLARGYSLVWDADGRRLLRSAQDVAVGDSVSITLHDGRLRAAVTATESR